MEGYGTETASAGYVGGDLAKVGVVSSNLIARSKILS